VRTRVKICGVCRPEDAAAAVDAGADAVGVVLAESPRRVTMAQAGAIMAEVPAPVARVGVFVDESEAVVAEAVAMLGLSYVQFHGTETPERCAEAAAPVVKAFRVGPRFDVAKLEPYRGSVAAVLLDALVPGVAGGTGECFEWESLPALESRPRVFVAGGLHPGNVGRAVRTLRPFAVDVSGGVEAGPREKHPQAIAEFVAAVRAADREGS
jgi:phosphoribosylanthranilate isomerase